MNLLKRFLLIKLIWNNRIRDRIKFRSLKTREEEWSRMPTLKLRLMVGMVTRSNDQIRSPQCKFETHLESVKYRSYEDSFVVVHIELLQSKTEQTNYKSNIMPYRYILLTRIWNSSFNKEKQLICYVILYSLLGHSRRKMNLKLRSYSDILHIIGSKLRYSCDRMISISTDRVFVYK